MLLHRKGYGSEAINGDMTGKIDARLASLTVPFSSRSFEIPSRCAVLHVSPLAVGLESVDQSSIVTIDERHVGETER